MLGEPAGNLVESDRMDQLVARVESHLPPDSGRLYQQLTGGVIEHNASLNLVADADEGEILRRHLLDSLIGLRVLDLLQTDAPLSVMDVGSGGGFPGLVLAVARSEWSFVLVDSSQKKVGFLLKMIQLLDLGNVRVMRQRAENLPTDIAVDVCIARAVAPVGRLVQMTAHLPRHGGFFCWWKGPAAVDELQEAERPLREGKIRIIGRYPYRLPSDGIARSIVLAQKVS